MANRYGYEDEPRPRQGWAPDERGQWQGEGEVGEHDRPWMRGREPEFGVRRGGGYGLGGADRGYNQGGYGGLGSYEEGYTPGSYDRLLDQSERRSGYGDEDYGRDWEEDERSWYERNQGRWSARTYGGRRPDERSREPLRGGGLEWTARPRVQGKAPKGYTRSDERIREDICERLMRTPLDASDVEVAVNRGEVTLTGTVRSRVEKWGIEDVAESVLGVQEVNNQIRLNRGEAQASTAAPSAGDTRHLHS